MAGDGEWIEVRILCRYPDNRRASSPAKTITPVYTPFQPTYAQVLSRNSRPSSPAMTSQISDKTSNHSSRPNSPTNSTKSTYYVSPHSPSRLRFPSSPSFAEWKGRCFKCTRTGHKAANCRNPKKCGRCWSNGHIGSHCTQNIVPPPISTQKRPQPTPHSIGEPGFNELLTGSYPYRSPEMPTDRPICLHTFFERDDKHYAELNRLKQAVVIHTSGFQWELSPDNIGDYAIRTGLVSREEIQVSELSGSRFLIVLSKELDPETFINATPQSAWDEGISFQPWSPLDKAEISIPIYKVLVGLTGIPPFLWREDRISEALNTFFLYLGSVMPEDPAKLNYWIAVVAVDDLSLVPLKVAMYIGGLVHKAAVHTIAFKRTPLYPASKMPSKLKATTTTITL